MRQLARSGTHVYSNRSLRALLREALPVTSIEDLAVPFQCAAASIERSSAVYFDTGPLLDAVLASSAVPGLLRPVEIDGEHYLDGGLVDSIPLGRAVDLGATDVYVLQVGRVEQPLSVPRKPWEVAMVAFEIARRHRFVRDLDAVPADVTVHVLPTGEQLRYNDPSQLRYRNFSRTSSRIERSYARSHDVPGPPGRRAATHEPARAAPVGPPAGACALWRCWAWPCCSPRCRCCWSWPSWRRRSSRAPGGDCDSSRSPWSTH